MTLTITRAAAVVLLVASGGLAASVLASDPAIASEPIASPPPRGTVWTVMNHVRATVCDDYAIVQVVADIGNRGPDPEFPFRVTIPDDAFVTGLTIERDGETFVASVEKREEAREIYEDVKDRQATGGLVEKARHSSTYAFLVNVAEFTSVRATLTYERYLAAEEGEHRLALEAPISGFGQDLGADFDVRLCHSDGVTGAWTEPAGHAVREGGDWRATYAVGPRGSSEGTPFDVTYTVAHTSRAGSVIGVASGSQGWFAHRFAAPADAELLPLDLVIVLDVSGSMSGEKMRQMQDAAAQVVGVLTEEDRLHLVLFSSEASAPWEGLEPATRSRRESARAEIAHAFAAGGTNLGAGIREGFAAYSERASSADALLGGLSAGDGERLPLLVFLTDGQATNGETDRSRLRAMAREANDVDASVYAIAFGADADWTFIRQLAEDGSGRAIRVAEGSGAEVDLSRFMTALTTPALKDVVVRYDGEVAPYRNARSVLFAGSELLVVGTFDAHLDSLSGRVTATAPDGAREYAFDEPVLRSGADFLPRLVAYHEIRDLQERISAEGERAAWVDRVVELALEFGFVTDYTSLVLSLPDARGTPPPCMECSWDSASVGAPLARETSDGAAGPSGAPAQGLRDASPPAAPTPAPAHRAASEPKPSIPGAPTALALAAVGAVAALTRRRAAE